MSVITRDSLARELAERAEITQTAAKDEVSWFFGTISEALVGGDEVRIHGFGSFKTVQKKARKARNPKTGEAVMVPARRGLRFTPSTTLTATVREITGGKKKKKAGR